MDIEDKYKNLIETLNKIGIALSNEDDRRILLKKILKGAMTLTHADGGTLYLVQDDKLSFCMIANDTLKIDSSNMVETDLPLSSISLYVDGKPNIKNIVSYSFHQGKTVTIDDAYNIEQFDFSGMRETDKKLSYYSKSFLTIPLKNHEKKILGILQLINAIDENGEIVPFDESKIIIAESLASQAAVTLTKFELIKAQKKLFESLLRLIASAIDEKSAHTSNHCVRVPVITKLIAESFNKHKLLTHATPLTKNEMDELMIAAWLHDCGKIVIPDHVINKSTKLETIMDRIELIDARFEILKRDAKIEYLEKINKNEGDKIKLEKEFHARINDLIKAQQIIKNANIGGEFLSNDEIQIIKELGTKNTLKLNETSTPLLTDLEMANLCIPRGTLNDEERQVIQNHVKVTYEMLRTLPYPEELKNVPEIAGSHHERMDGKGYPRGIKSENLSIPARILAIADIFEALTSADRPYKTPKPLDEVLSIMENMQKAGHIDGDIFEIFVENKIYLTYGLQFLKPEQLNIE